MAKQSPLRIAVGSATAGRREALTLTLQVLGELAHFPDLVVVCPAKPADFDESIRTRTGRPAEPAQRHPRAHGRQRRRDRVRNQATPRASAKVEQIYNLYGCNMAFRMAPIVLQDLRFDGRLPRYGWLEDVDFSRSVARFGKLVESDGRRGVHLAVKRGRTSGFNFGYSQVANPLYLSWKGTMSADRALRLRCRNVARNVQRAVSPEPWIDRRGRLRGNAVAMRDLLRGRLHPENTVNPS